MKLHWSPRSPYVRKVMVCAHELGLADRLQLVRSVAAMRKPNAELMLDNPMSKIPTLVLEDGTALFDSIVICEYLNDLAEGSLFPQHGAAKWQALRWHAFADNVIDGLILWRNERERPAPDADLLSSFDLRVRASLQRLQDEVEALAAAPFSIGQVTLACLLGYLDYRFAAFDWRGQVPKLAQWSAEALEARPSVRATVAV
ncbi:MAG TPA: glutathione S-transferase, partial [Ramlibacter sp.]|nr:glutathione S-transferase [Ramlibacter sp.]